MKITPAFAVTIPNPCHENWELMTPQEQGRHCKVCNKVVTDFTTMTNEEIILYLQSAKESVCGRIEEEEDSPFLQPYIPLSKQAKLFLYALAISFFTQVPLNLVGQEVKDSTQTNNMKYGEIRGRVTNQEGKPMNSALVRIFQNHTLMGSTTTDSSGHYTIKHLKQGEYRLTVYQLDYTTEELQRIQVKMNKVETINFKLEPWSKSARHNTGIKTFGRMLLIDTSSNKSNGVNIKDR